MARAGYFIWSMGHGGAFGKLYSLGGAREISAVHYI